MSPVLGVVLVLAAAGRLAAQEEPAPAARILVFTREPLRVPVECRAADFEAAHLGCSAEEPCDVFLELTSIEAAGSKVIVAGNLHTAAATLASIVLLSDDGGGRWREPAPRLPSATAEAIQFLNDQQGWIAVQNEQQFPVDPFLLATSDGGAHWQSRRIFPEEGRVGLLQQFSFDSPQHGLALIDRSHSGPSSDRYELYESMNGGASWMLRETSRRPIEVKWPARRPSEWRLREDGKAKTYEIERRVGAAWRRMASFRIDVAQCREMQEAPKPKPADEPAAAPAPGDP